MRYEWDINESCWSKEDVSVPGTAAEEIVSVVWALAKMLWHRVIARLDPLSHNPTRVGRAFLARRRHR